jgi:hypothetical protein
MRSSTTSHFDLMQLFRYTKEAWTLPIIIEA